MKHYPTFKDAIKGSGDTLKRTGTIITSESWQGIHKSREMFEVFDIAFQVPMVGIGQLRQAIEPNLPWADEHFDERISGIPYNPPPSNSRWPMGDASTSKVGEIFSHTYPERFWPKTVGNRERYHKAAHDTESITTSFAFNELNKENMGVRYPLGDLDDLIELLYKEPNTRQAYLPIWFPEDTGAVQGQRVPCTLGYYFRYHNGYLHITYKIRSCDYIRHFKDDIYMAARLLNHILVSLRLRELDTDKKLWHKTNLGFFKMQIDSLHVFALEKDLINSL